MWASGSDARILKASQTMLRLERAPNLSFLSFRLELYAEREGFKRLDHVSDSR